MLINLAGFCQVASAGVNCTLPFTFINGTLADANQVNANNAALVACLLNAAGAGNNNDITALLALTTPISSAAGGSTVYVGGVSTGSSNAQVVAVPVPTGFALTRGNSVIFVAGPTLTNTGATTLAVAATAATNVFRATPSGPQALTGGEIIAGNIVWAVYDGTQYQIVSNGPQFGGFGPQVTLASAGCAGTCDLGLVGTHNVVISGVTTVTSFGASANLTYPVYKLAFNNNLTLTNSVSLLLPSGKNIITQPNDTAEAMYLGGGNWAVTSYSPATGASVVSPTPLCGFSGLSISNGASNTLISWSFNTSNLLNATGIPQFSTAKSGTINITTGVSGTSTAGGMDGTSPGNNTFAYLYTIYNGTTWSGVGSVTPPTAGGPVLPAGYTFQCYMGAIKTNGAGNLYGTRIQGNEARYIAGGANLTSIPLVANGVGTSTVCGTAAPGWQSFTVQGNTGAGVWIPTTATMSDWMVFSNYNNPGASASVLLAPNASYGGILGAGSTNPAPLGIGSTTIFSVLGRFMVEATTVQFCTAAAGGAFYSYGWKDAVNAN